MSWQDAFDLASLPQLWHSWSHCSDMLTLTSLTIRLCWKHTGSSGSRFAGSGESGFAGSCESGFAGSCGSGFAERKLVVVYLASLQGSNCLRWYRTIWLRRKQWICICCNELGKSGFDTTCHHRSGFKCSSGSGIAESWQGCVTYQSCRNNLKV